MHENNIIQDKILNILNNPPKSVGVLEADTLSYMDIHNIWNYFRINNQDYIDKHGLIEINWTDTQYDNYKNLFNSYGDNYNLD